MIQSLAIHNFQSHRDTTLDLVPGINIMVGQSDSGKSSILRALRWLLWNRPSGDAIRSHWGGDTSVYAEINEHQVSKVRTDHNNLYYLDGDSFTAFGADVPEEIQQACNITDVNFQSQLERPFLLDSTPGQVAAYLNSIADLSVIDSSMKNVQRWITGLKTDLSKHRANRDEYAEGLKAFAHLPEMEKDIRAAEQLNKELAEEQQDHIDLFHLHDSIGQTNQKIERFQPILALEKRVDAALETITKIKEGKQNCIDLFETISDISHNKTKIQKLKSLTDLERPVLTAEQLQQTIRIRETEHQELDSLNEKIHAQDQSIEMKKAKVKQLEELFHLQMPDVCPLCGQEVPK